MSAVLDKPRAKAKPKAPVRTAQSATAELIANLTRGVDKIGLAHDAAEPGEPAEVLIEHITEILADSIRPLWNEPLTKADTDAAYNAMFVPLAALKGAIALSKDTVIEHVLVEAHAVLDAAQTSIDSCAGLSCLLPDGAAREEADFLLGRDLAVSMLADADEVQATNPDSAYAKRAYRDGKEQHRFTAQYLRQLLKAPALLGGFSAVLSAKLADQCSSPARHYGVPMAEYQAGSIGADGTTPLDDDAPAEEPGPTGPVTLQASAPTLIEGDEWGDFDPYCLLLQARDVAETAANDDGSEDSMWGLHSLIEKSVEKVSKVVERANAGSEDVCSRASDELAGVLGVLHAVNTDGLDNPLLYAVESLLLMAKRQIDANVERLIQARLGRGAA